MLGKNLRHAQKKVWRTVAAERLANIPEEFKILVKEIIVALENAEPASCAGPIGGYANLAFMAEYFIMKPDEKGVILERMKKEYELK